MENIAIIGIANIFPGSTAPETFWQQLLDKKDSRRPATDQEMGVVPEQFLGKKGDTDKYYCISGGYIDQANFDLSGLSVGADYLAKLDDLYHWSLAVAKTALTDAGYFQHAALQQCGVILGNLSFPTKSSNQLFLPLYHQAVQDALKKSLHKDFQLAHYSDFKAVDADNGLISGYPAALIAKALGLGAAHLALDAACASSCYAVQLACDYLQTGKADMMLAGAVSGSDPMFVNMGFSIFQAYPENNRSAPLDKNSQGLFAGEGAGMLLLKRHSDALRDGDTIYAIVKGGGLSNDGKGEFVLAPNSKGQVLAFERAYQNAEVSPKEAAFIECHATGTPKGDKVELSSMETFFQKTGNQPLLGSVKSNLGHLLTAAGMPGMMKAILALQKGQIPPTINMQQPNQSKNAYFSGAQIPTNTVSWPNTDAIRTAGVSVFGFGGCDAHLVFQSANAPCLEKQQKLKAAEPLAIIGMDCHFASCEDLQGFKNLLIQQQSAIRALPEKRWKGLQHNATVLKAMGLEQAPEGGFIESFELDFLRFKVPPNEKDQLIAQQLLTMKVADNAILDAGLNESSNVAVLVAMGTELELHQYRGRVNLTTQIQQSLAEQGIHLSHEEQNKLINISKDAVAQAAQLNQYTSFIGNIMASRIAALWDFSGPAMTVSDEENSVFRCLELADNLFQTSDVEAVVIAAVDLAGSIENISLRQHFNGDGWQAGDGAGAIVLMPQSQADDKKVYAKIDGLAFANNLQEACQKALKQAQLSAEQIAAIELNQNGFADDNAKEQQAIQAVYGNKAQGSVKNQIGHLFSAQGMASIIRSALIVNDSGKLPMAINSFAREENYAHLIISGTEARRALEKPQAPNARKLLRKIYLGGENIEQTISQVVAALHLTVPPQLNAVANPLRLDNLLAGDTSHSEQTKQGHHEQNNQGHCGLDPQSTHTILQAGQSMTSANDSLIEQQAKTHLAFLQMRQAAQRKLAALILGEKSDIQMPASAIAAKAQPISRKTAANLGIKLVERFNQPKNIVFNTADLVEFAEGDISKVFGPEYAIIDTYKRRVRLPTTDYLLVTRVTDLDATVHQFKPCSMATEYDIPVDAPFLIDGQIPWSVSVESGQCDLMLISYLGIDFACKGERVYRLLDCQLTFMDDMAFGGETLRYEIKIDSYAKNGDQLLFFFHYDCFVNGKVVLKMRNGCAGFFTDAELDEGKGVILNDKDKAEIANAKKSYFKPLIENPRRSFDYSDMMKLVNGDIAGCFGSAYQQQGLNPSLKFSSKKFLMIEEVLSIDPQGGPWGLGVLEGRKRLEPDHWYFPCHFKDDQVMAGSLMSEGCGQLAMFYMLWLGMHSQSQNARFQPVAGQAQTVRCRGQVTPQSADLIYRMTVTEMGMSPAPYVKANIDIILNGRVVVDFKNLAVMIKEQDPNHPYAAKIIDSGLGLNDSNVSLRADFSQSSRATTRDPQPQTDERGVAAFADVDAPLMWVESDLSAAKNKGVVPIKHVPAPMANDKQKQNRIPNQLPFTPWHLFEFATGNISNCFGSEFDVYQGRIPPRTPCGDLQLVTQVIDIKGNRGDLKNISSCVAEYEVPEDAWYFTKNSHNSWMPYSILMEISLQPNGFISGYMGTTLKYPEKDLFFRNLDGRGKLLREVDLRGKTITNKSVMLSTSIAGGSIIQSFTFELLTDNQPFYQGTAVFGYFSEHALTHQLGIDNGRITQAWFVDNNTPEKDKTVIDLSNKQLSFYLAPQDKPHYRLAGGQMNFVDTVTIVENGGEFGQGYIYGQRTIDPSDWFFRYHFHQDPVMPGSLGVEAMVELLQTYALKNDLGKSFKNPRFIAPLSEVIWKYRGQITPENKQMSLDVHIKEVIKTNDEVRIIGDANLSKDGLRIYHVKDIVLSIVES